MTSTTLSQQERINILRQKITDEIRSKINAPGPIRPLEISRETLEYEQNDHLPITPILDFDERKKNEKFKLRALRSTTSSVKIQNGGESGKGVEPFSQLRSNIAKVIRKKKIRPKKPLEIFYRRVYDKEILHHFVEWLHCQDIITPFLSGAKLNMSNPTRLNTKDPTVQRFISLLNINTSTYSREEVYTILYQISNLNLRLFQWDVPSLNMLLNIIIKEKKHTFLNLKSGIREMFQNWRLDFTNTTTILKQARIFRPPCVYITTAEGSTKLPKVTKFPKKLSATTHCEVDDDDCKDERK